MSTLYGHLKSGGKYENNSSSLGFASSNVKEGGSCKTRAKTFSYIGVSENKNLKTCSLTFLIFSHV